MLLTLKKAEQAAISFTWKGFDISFSLSPASQSEISPFPQPTVSEMIFPSQYMKTKLLYTRTNWIISTYCQVKNERKDENPCLSLLSLDVTYKQQFWEGHQVTKRLVGLEQDK